MDIHKAVVMGCIRRKVYVFSERYWGRGINGNLYEDTKLLEYVEVRSGELENPPLEEGDDLYIADLNKKVKIKEKAKSTEGGYVYWTNYIVDVIEDETTEETKVKAEKSLREFEERMKLKRECEQSKIDRILNDEINKKWWQFWK